MNTEIEHRKFSRIGFDASVELNQAELHCSCELIDLSLKGLLVSKPIGINFDDQQPIMATISLSADTAIRMVVTPVHQEGEHLGFICTSIDLDSVAHLRRLVELNLDNEHALERELSEFASYGL